MSKDWTPVELEAASQTRYAVKSTYRHMGGNQMKIIDRLVDMQDAGSPVCPRCGRWTMVHPLTHNALSRVAENVYVCNDCGMDEALRDFGRIPLPVEEWAIPKLWRETKK